jgi:hypothetical protein
VFNKLLFCEAVESLTATRVRARFRVVDGEAEGKDKPTVGRLILDFDSNGCPITGQWYELSICGQLGGGDSPSPRAVTNATALVSFTKADR